MRDRCKPVPPLPCEILLSELLPARQGRSSSDPKAHPESSFCRASVYSFLRVLCFRIGIFPGPCVQPQRRSLRRRGALVWFQQLFAVSFPTTQVQARQPILPGEEITCSYVQAEAGREREQKHVCVCVSRGSRTVRFRVLVSVAARVASQLVPKPAARPPAAVWAYLQMSLADLDWPQHDAAAVWHLVLTRADFSLAPWQSSPG